MGTRGSFLWSNSADHLSPSRVEIKKEWRHSLPLQPLYVFMRRTTTASHSPCKGKGLPQQAEMAQGVPGKLRPRNFLTFGTTKVVGRQAYAPAAFTPGDTHF